MYRGKHFPPRRRLRSLALGALIALVLTAGGVGAVELHGKRPGLAVAALTSRLALPAGSGPERRDASRPVASANVPSAAQAEAALERLASLGFPVYCGGRSKPLVALTFDDGPGPYTLPTMAILRSFGDAATFFLVGKELKAYPTLEGVPRLERQLGAVGDHTWTHPNLLGLPPSGLQHEIADTQRAIAAASGGPVLLFRPPYGGQDSAVESYVKSLGMVDVIWTIDSGDSHGAGPSRVLRNVVKGLRPGAIILLHENRGSTFAVLPQILRAMRARGLQAVTLPALLTLDPPTVAELRHPNLCAVR
jgi:peptidoglycan/xylan/chitin deacetylase (PgdA/CDA1 family)